MHLATPEDTEAAGASIAGLVEPGDVIALYGDLGMGKTTLARGLLRGLGYQGEVGSPTFPIVQTYDPPEVRIPVWHVDLYRVESAAELVELALDEARLDSLLLIEWPERLGAALWPDALKLTLTRTSEGGRALTAQVPPAWERRWPR
jgi:tRNA threonylcarbamoyladenosine biosynthesis protein TsaE